MYKFIIIVIIVFSILGLLMELYIHYNFDSNKNELWDKLENSTWRNNQDWAGESCVFYTNNLGVRKCIHQIQGSGVYVISREYYKIKIINEKEIEINKILYKYENNKLISTYTTLELQDNKPLVYNHKGLVEMKKVKSIRFDIKDINS